MCFFLSFFTFHSDGVYISLMVYSQVPDGSTRQRQRQRQLVDV